MDSAGAGLMQRSSQDLESSVAEVIIIHILWSWWKFLAVSYISSVPQRGAHFFEIDQVPRKASQIA